MLYVVFVFSVTLHEAAHAWVAKLGGDLTAYRGGQVTLDPRPHMAREPIGMIVLPIFGLIVAGWPFGFASAPYDPEWALRHPRRAGWMAAAGPLSNLLLVIISGLGLFAAFHFGWVMPPEYLEFGRLADYMGDNRLAYGLTMFGGMMLSLNLLLFILNLIPLPPLDGSAVLNILLGDKIGRRYQQFLWRSPWMGLIGLLLAWNLIGKIFWPFLFLCLSLIYSGG